MSPVWTFGDRLIRIRKTMGLSQSQMAELIEVAPKSISRWENDDHVRDPHDVALRYAKVSGYEYEWIIGRAAAGDLQLPNSQEIRVELAPAA